MKPDNIEAIYASENPMICNPTIHYELITSWNFRPYKVFFDMHNDEQNEMDSKIHDHQVSSKFLQLRYTPVDTLERLIKNAILTYTHEKKYVKDADKNEISFTKGFKDTDDSPMPFRWLGKDFKKLVSKPTAKTLEISGDNQEIRMRPHWRRGHWHNVCIGTKRKERQLRWFKPVFVNAG